MDVKEHKPRGRPPTFGPAGNPRMTGVHLNMAADVWEALKDYAAAISEPSVSRAARVLLRERLIEMGFLKSPPRPAHQNPN